jgi:MFS family permease
MSTTMARAARRITRFLLLAQGLSSAGFIATATLNSLVAAEIGGRVAWVGLPSAIYLGGSALSSLGWGLGMERLGRRAGLGAGLALGTLGAGLAAWGVIRGVLGLFLLGLGFLGSANAAMQLGRFAAAEVHRPSARGRAISTVIFGGTVGAVAGPLLVGPAGTWAQAQGLNPLAGAYLAGVALLGGAAIVIVAGLHPDPSELGQSIAHAYPEEMPAPLDDRPVRQTLRLPGVRIAILAMVFGQVVMVMLMVITALHMKQHAHDLGDISLVISLHTFGMYAFSILSGRMVDRWGRRPVIMTGATILIVACLMAPMSPQTPTLGLALFLLGLGWNLCYVGGSTLLADHLLPTERPRVQGFSDLLIGLLSALGSLGSGLVFAGVGYAAMGRIGAALAGIALVLLVWWRPASMRATPIGVAA